MSEAGDGTGLVVEHLVARFGEVVAVNDVSFSAAPGEFVSLLGPSGCGKTTSLRCIAGFERPTGGRIHIDGEVVADAATGHFTPPNRRHFGMVFQSYAIWPHMNVLQNVGYPLQVRGRLSRAEIRERVDEKLRTVGLSGLEMRFPAQLSGGQQQRVALARALVMEPRALLFDEPLSNLDAKLRERMRFELIEIQAGLGVPAVYVTHDQAEAMVMSKRVVVMEGGRIVQQGDPEHIYARPTSRFVADFIGLSNFVPAQIIERLDAPAAGAASTWRCLSALGTHGCTAQHADPDSGADVLLAIRPERIQISATPFDEDGFAVELRNQFFLGPYTEYFLAVGDVVLRAQTSARLALRPGERLYARIPTEHCQVVAADRAALVEDSV